jgi:hypothetical protein
MCEKVIEAENPRHEAWRHASFFVLLRMISMREDTHRGGMGYKKVRGLVAISKVINNHTLERCYRH